MAQSIEAGRKAHYAVQERHLTQLEEIKEDFSAEVMPKLRNKEERVQLGKEVGDHEAGLSGPALKTGRKEWSAKGTEGMPSLNYGAVLNIFNLAHLPVEGPKNHWG